MNAGFIISSHFCMGELNSIEISQFGEPDGCCESGCHCCHTKIVHFKIDDKPVIVKVKPSFTSLPVLLPRILIVDDKNTQENNKFQIDNYLIGYTPPLYLENRILLI